MQRVLYILCSRSYIQLRIKAFNDISAKSLLAHTIRHTAEKNAGKESFTKKNPQREFKKNIRESKKYLLKYSIEFFFFIFLLLLEDSRIFKRNYNLDYWRPIKEMD